LYDSGPAAVGPQAAKDAQALLAALQYASPGDVYLLKEGIDAEAGREVPRGPVAQFLRQRWADTSAGHLIGMGQIAIGAPDRTVALAALSQALQLPVLVLYGALDDQIWSLADFAHLANRVASRTVVIPDSGHSPAVEAPEEMVRELDAFWRALT
jgi:pimeloyl-ACP methyl ester carboxylesterase